ncbi:MAG: GMC family oxidoreductase [Actinobacteria bacterium]|nr:GMC family oxidoreductase [Actinomycetota bacterium]
MSPRSAEAVAAPTVSGDARRDALSDRELDWLRAYARTLLPAAHGLPGGDAEVATAVARLLAHAPARTRSAARLGLRLARIRGNRAATRLESSGSMALRSLGLLLKALCCVAYVRSPEVMSAIGAAPRCELGPEAVVPPLPPHLDRDAMKPPEGEVESCDVLVVGSGAGGAAAARILAEVGLDVIVVEEGSYSDALTYSRDPLDALTTLYRDGGLTACEGRPPIPLPLGRCVGGTTVINSGTCFRAPPDVLLSWRDVHGIPWATDLDREYEALERDLAVGLVSPRLAGRNAELCRAGAEALGLSNGPIPRNSGGVTCCGTCPTGCALDAKRAMHVSELPRAVAAGARIRAGVRVLKVVVQRGRVSGVVGRIGDAGRYVAAARAVVLAGGAVGTPELLLSQGIANGSGHVGRHLRLQPACWVGARFRDQPVHGWDGVMQGWRVDEWLAQGLFLEATFTPPPFGAHWLPGAAERLMERIAAYRELAIIGVHVADESEGRVMVGRDGRLRLTYGLRRIDAAKLRFGIARAARIHFAAGAAEVYPQVAGLPAIGPGQEGRVEDGRARPSALRLEAFHPMGTARIGTDPRRSVVSPTGESHEVGGLYVADASILPTALGANPMLTIMACARQVARGVASEMQ